MRGPLRSLAAVGTRLLLRASGLPSLPPERVDDRFPSLADRLLAGDPSAFDTPELPRLELLRWLAEQRPVLFHGSQNGGLEVLNPIRLSTDAREFGNQEAVFATDDPVWAMWFAILRRDGGFRSTRNGSLAVAGEPPSARRYFFAVNDGALAPDRFAPGFLYVVPRAAFHKEPAMSGLLDTAQWASPEPARPLVRLELEPEDFPFLETVIAHGDESIATTILRSGAQARRVRRKRT